MIGLRFQAEIRRQNMDLIPVRKLPDAESGVGLLL